MRIVLGVHPGERHERESKSSERYKYACRTCKDGNRPYIVVQTPGPPVICDLCQQQCVPYVVPALPNQHGIWIGGNADCDPEDKAALIAAAYKCVGYCDRKANPEVWYVDKVPESTEQAIDEAIRAKYGGTPRVFPKVEVPDEDDDLDAADDDDEEGEGDEVDE